MKGRQARPVEYRSQKRLVPGKLCWRLLLSVSDRRPAGERCALRKGATRTPRRSLQGRHGARAGGTRHVCGLRATDAAFLPSCFTLHPMSTRRCNAALLALCPTRSPETSREPANERSWSTGHVVSPPTTSILIHCLALAGLALPCLALPCLPLACRRKQTASQVGKPPFSNRPGRGYSCIDTTR